MEQLQINNKLAKSHANSAFYMIIFLIVVFVLVLIGIIFVFSQSNNFKQAAPSMSNIPLKTLLYALGGIVALGLIFVLINSRYEIYFQKKQQVGINRSLPPSKLFWAPGYVSETTMEIKSEEFPMTSAATYSVGFEIFVSDTRSDDQQGPFRHIIHRGSRDIVDFKRNSPGSVPKGMGGLNDGLPSEMNPGVFIDPFTNDLMLFIDTDPSKNGDYGFRESIRVIDIPLKKPFAVHLTIHDQILEVYINCRLAGSKVLRGIPRAVPNNWYGLAGFSPSQAIIQNVKLWDIDLYATELRNMCPDIQISKDAKSKAKANCSKC